MFENIIGQTAAVSALRQELAAGSLPPSLLLHGPPYSGKMSVALEIARVLTCTQKADWSCACPACRRQRLLLHPCTLLAGTRYFELEIAAAADVLRRVRKPPARYLFLRAVRKLLRRFDPLLWEGEESRVRHLEPALAQVEESLDELSPEREEGWLSEEALERSLEAIVASCRQLARALPADNIPLHVLRRACSWLHLSSPEAGARKILILENADRMLEASASSLLKLLEEPPRQATLILTTARRAAVIPTVLSRLRPYAFFERKPEESAAILTRIFREASGVYGSLRDYFLCWQELNPEELRLLAQRFAALALASPAGEDAETEEILGMIKKLLSGKSARAAALIFFEELLLRFQVLLRKEAVEPLALRRWNRALRQHLEACERYNQNPVLNLESLYYSLRGSR